jgi:pantetheine-phosphate adenylyltransferase
MRKAIYPGSFDPLTLGHMDIIERSAGLFDELVIGVGVNSDKKPFMNVETRLELLRQCTSGWNNVKVEPFDGLLVDFARTNGCRIVLRGLRAVSDFEYEFRVAMANRRMAPEVETMFLMTRDELSFLSSSVVREVARLHGDVSKFVPPAVALKIQSLRFLP